MILKELTPPPGDPVSMAELAAHLRLNYGFADTGVEDALLQLYLRNATAAIEARLGQALVRRSFIVETDCWDRKGRIVLPIGPVVEVISLTLLRGDVATSMSTGGLMVSSGASRQILSGLGSTALPTIPTGGIARITFDAGHGIDPDGVPGNLRQAVLILAAHLYEHRLGGEDDAMPGSVATLIQQHRAVRL